MANILTSVQLSQISELIVAKMGLYFSESRWPDLERGLTSAAAAGKFADVKAYCQSLLSAPLTHTQIEELSLHLTVGETYFFREKPTFQALRESVFPELIRARRASTKRLRIWSAGCCTGEEAYSSAILLSQLIPDLNEWSLSILATDINPQFLRKAREGVYGEWSFRDVPPQIKEHYFTQRAKGRFEILPSIKQRVEFALLNLAEESYPSPQNHTNAVDLIFCRNVLMYFSPEQAKRVARRFYDSLAVGGWLVVSLGEASHQLFADFKTVQFPNAILYQKKGTSQAFQFEEGLTQRTENRLHENWRDQSTLFALPSMPQLSKPHQWRREDKDVVLDQHPRRNGLRPPNIARTPMSVPVVALPHTPNEALETGEGADRQASKSEKIYEQGQYVDAEAQALLEIAEKPEDAAALILLARICANQGRLDEALQWSERALAADRLNLRGYYLYASIQQERGEINEAISALKRTLYLHPEFVLAHFALGYLARRQGKKLEADKHFANMFALLNQYPAEEILPESDGLTAGRLAEMVRSSATSFVLPRGRSR